MINIDEWMKDLTSRLFEFFRSRLLFVGLQGSYRRGEATDASDIDSVVILDKLYFEDLKSIRKILATMPYRDKCCGFIGDAAALAAWPKHELFQFAGDTTPYRGDLNSLLPKPQKEDIVYAVSVGASALYHATAHSFLHAPAATLRELYKSAYFTLLAAHFLRSGYEDYYPQTRKELAEALTGREREIMEISINWDERKEDVLFQPDKYAELLFTWSKSVLTERF